MNLYMATGDSSSQPEIMENVHRYFATGVGLITTKGSKYGPNVMAAEWTMQISYEPMLIAIFVHESPTFWNIKESKVFGVNMASDDQANIVNIAGGYSGTEFNKLEIPGYFDVYQGKHIDVPMIKGCTLNAECKLVSVQEIGDHILVVGEAISARYDEKRFPLIYTRGNYRKISPIKIPPGRKKVVVSGDKFDVLKKISKGQFVLKAACAVIRDKKKILLVQDKSSDFMTVPFTIVERGPSYSETLKKYLDSLGLLAQVNGIVGIERYMIKDRDSKSETRANFLLFDCKLKSGAGPLSQWCDINKLPKKILLKSLVPRK